MTKNAKQKLKYLKNEKSFPVEKKHFSSFLKDFQLPKIISGLRVRNQKLLLRRSQNLFDFLDLKNLSRDKFWGAPTYADIIEF